MKKGILIGFILVVIAGVIGYYQWNRPNAQLTTKTADIKIEATALQAAFESNENESNTKYNDKIIEVSGKIAELDKTADGSVNILLETSNPMSVVMAQLDKSITHDVSGLSQGANIKLKGLCSGYTTDVVLDRCVIIE